mmetsp:Transcript_8487/g.27836  ORF Transcript_8487/g.27836 Transcript_8487/m.27836 type:complete len:128 (+) Transcript_8487:3-386(+)
MSAVAQDELDSYSGTQPEGSHALAPRAGIDGARLFGEEEPPAAADAKHSSLLTAREAAAKFTMPSRAGMTGCVQCPSAQREQRAEWLPCGHGPYLCTRCSKEMQAALDASHITREVVQLLCPVCYPR